MSPRSCDPSWAAARSSAGSQIRRLAEVEQEPPSRRQSGSCDQRARRDPWSPGAFHDLPSDPSRKTRCQRRREYRMRNPLLVPDLRELIQAGESAGLRDFFTDYHPARIAEVMEDLEPAEADQI